MPYLKWSEKKEEWLMSLKGKNKLWHFWWKLEGLLREILAYVYRENELFWEKILIYE